MQYDSKHIPDYVTLTNEDFLLEISETDQTAPNSPFEWVKAEDISKPNNKQKEFGVTECRDTIKHIQGAHVTKEESGNTYQISFEIDDPAELIGVEIATIGKPKATISLNSKSVIQRLDITELSELYEITISDKNGEKSSKTFVKKIPTSGIPESRDAEVTKMILSHEGVLESILQATLSNYPLSALAYQRQSNLSASQGQGTTPSAYVPQPCIYEKLLRASTEAPQKIRDLIPHLSIPHPETVSPEFQQKIEGLKKVLDVFQTAIEEENK